MALPHGSGVTCSLLTTPAPHLLCGDVKAAPACSTFVISLPGGWGEGQLKGEEDTLWAVQGWGLLSLADHISLPLDPALTSSF